MRWPGLRSSAASASSTLRFTAMFSASREKRIPAPRAGNLAERARAAGIRFSRLAENIAVNRNVEEAEAALLRSPGHRMNLLSPDFTRLGVGVAFDRDGQGERRVYVTENFLVP